MSAEVAGEFGEDPVPPELSGFIDEVRTRLLDLRSAMAGGIQLPEPGEETLGRILQLVQQDLTNTSALP